MKTGSESARSLLTKSTLVFAVLIALAGLAPAEPFDVEVAEAPFEVSPLEQLLPPADLSLCRYERDAIAPGQEVDLAEFAERLNGSWILGTRTIRGLPIDARATFLFDMEEAGESEARGTAVLIDFGNLGILDPLELTLACPKDATVAALWEVTIRKTTPHRLALIMDGEYFGSYGDFLHGVYQTERSSFAKLEGKYLSGRLVTPSGGKRMEDQNWDRVDFTDASLTYVSCEGRYLERYDKISDETPLLDGVSLRDGWAKRKADGSLLVPIPVDPLFTPDFEQSF